MDRGAPRRLHLADRDQLVAKRLERLHHRLEREVASLRFRMPGIWINAARKVDRAEAERRGRRCGERWDHGVQERKCDRGAQGTTHERAAREMLLRNEHGCSLID